MAEEDYVAPGVSLVMTNVNGVEKWFDRALVWIEYLVRIETYDRSLPGHWAHSVEGDMGNGQGMVWIVGGERLRDSILNAQRHHARTLLALQVLTGCGPIVNHEALIMQMILTRLPTYEARVAALGDRSPTTELLGVDLLEAPAPKPD